MFWELIYIPAHTNNPCCSLSHWPTQGSFLWLYVFSLSCPTNRETYLVPCFSLVSFWPAVFGFCCVLSYSIIRAFLIEEQKIVTRVLKASAAKKQWWSGQIKKIGKTCLWLIIACVVYIDHLRIAPWSLFSGLPDQSTWMFAEFDPGMVSVFWYAPWRHYANGLFG